MITEPDACTLCDGKIYWIENKKGERIAINPTGEPHIETCPKVR